MTAVLVGGAAVAATALTVPPAGATTIPAGSVTVQHTFSTFNSNNKTYRAACPAGQRVLGGGGSVNGTRHAVLTELKPVSTPFGDYYEVSAAEDQTGDANVWNLHVYAYCSATAPGVQIVSVPSASASNPFTSVGATCPGSKRLAGSGGQITGGNGQVDLVTYPEGSRLSNSTTAGGQEDPDGFTGNWTVTSYAVCVTASDLFDLQVVRSFTSGDGTASQTAFVRCPAGMRVTGGAGWADTPAHVEFVAADNGFPETAVLVGAVAGTPFRSGVVAIAICAR
jgi:hypothetical protein